MQAIADGRSPLSWLVFLLPVLLLAAAGIACVVTGDSGGHRGPRAIVARFGSTLTRVTGLPAWGAAGLITSGWALVVAVTGFIWDVDWHVEFGRDSALFTVPHVMILAGLFSIGIAACLAIGLATLDGATTGWRIGPLRVPYSALPMGLLSFGAVCGFPLDDLWHQTYGIDVTMWSPTHLLMIGGASLTTITLAMMTMEAGRAAPGLNLTRFQGASLAGAVLIGLSTLQLEFDLGVPQWQGAYHPLLVTIAAAMALVGARAALGRGGALAAALFFIGLRLGLLLLMGGMGLLLPAFPLYLASALLVEIGFVTLGRRSPLIVAGITGLLVSTAGLAAEWGWNNLTSGHPWHLTMLPRLWPVIPAALAAAVIGIAAGRVLSGVRSGIPAGIVAAAVVLVAAMLAVPFPRTTTPVSAHVTTQAAGPETMALSRDGVPNPRRDMTLTVRLQPADAAAGADWFEVTAWQGGGARHVAMTEIGPGTYRTAGAFPTGGTWKAMVFLARGDVMMALPISLPSDITYGQPAVAPAAESDQSFVPATAVLTRESHGGAPLVAILGTGMFGLMLLVWILAIAAGCAALSRTSGVGANLPADEGAANSRRAFRRAT